MEFILSAILLLAAVMLIAGIIKGLAFLFKVLGFVLAFFVSFVALLILCIFLFMAVIAVLT